MRSGYPLCFLPTLGPPKFRAQQETQYRTPYGLRTHMLLSGGSLAHFKELHTWIHAWLVTHVFAPRKAGWSTTGCRWNSHQGKPGCIRFIILQTALFRRILQSRAAGREWRGSRKATKERNKEVLSWLTIHVCMYTSLVVLAAWLYSYSSLLTPFALCPA